MTVGLAGGYCAGKDAVARIFEKHGFHVIDEDAVGHEVLDGMADRIASAFGPAAVSADGRVDRKALGRIVFGSPAALSRLEALVHPGMKALTAERVKAAGGNVLINAAILFKMGLDGICDAVVYVTSPAVIRVFRAARRDQIPLSAAFRRVFSQQGIRPKSFGGPVDIYTIANGGTMRSLERSAEAVVQRIMRGQAR